MDGAIEFLGRLDHQVKLRGFRIELGEIEAALGQHPEVKSSVATVRDDTPAGKQLVAYVVRQPGSTLTVVQLRQHLQERLPDYMIPGTVTFLEALPMNGSGKVDRLRLPAPTMDPRAAQSSKAAEPTNVVEADVMHVWSEVLGHSNFGVHDRFFEVGGHSLLALQVIQHLETAWNRRVPVRELFEHPTIAALARSSFAPDRTLALDGKFLVRLRAGGGDSPLYVQPGGWGEENELLAMATLAAHLDAPQAVMGIRSRVLDESWKFPSSLAAHAGAVLEEIQRHQPSGALHLVGECLGGMATLELARLALAKGYAISPLILLDTVIPPRRRYWHYRLRHDGPLARWLGGRSRQQANQNKHPLDDLPPRVRQWYRLLLGAQPEPVDCHVHLILSQQLAGDERKLNAWRRVAKRGVTVHFVAGSHDSYIREGALQTSAVLRTLLPRA
jgi:thioesterase domain-containing protein